jgi:hypothetical protein
MRFGPTMSKFWEAKPEKRLCDWARPGPIFWGHARKVSMRLRASTARLVPNDKAEPLYQKALLMKKSVIGEEHAGHASSLDGFGRLYRTEGAHDKAERPPSRLPGQVIRNRRRASGGYESPELQLPI